MARLCWLVPDGQHGNPGYDGPMATESHSSDGIERRVIRVIAETQQIELGKITPRSTFEELGIDSFDGINILFALETEFAVSIPDEEANGLRSVAQVTQGIESLLAQGHVSKPV